MGELTEVQRAYAAGFFDGDGTCNIGHGGNNNDLVHVIVGVTQKDRECLDWLVEHFGGTIVRERDRYWRWTPKSKEAFLREIAPYLVLKKERVTRLLEGYYDVAKLRYGSRGLPPGELQKRRELVNWFKTVTLATKGKPST